METVSVEYRKHSRTKLQTPQTIWIAVTDKGVLRDWTTGILVDYSQFGLGVKLDTPIQSGVRVLVRGRLDQQKSSAEQHLYATVRWCMDRMEGSYRAGLALEKPLGAGEKPKQKSQKKAPPREEILEEDYYDYLQVSPKAEPETIHRVFRLLAQRYHPDNGDTGDEESFKRLMVAYRTLSDPEQRASYDLERSRKREVRWRIFDRPKAAGGVEAERRKRQGILELLYTKRLNDPRSPTLTIHEFEDLLACPREHLETTLWFLREKGWVSRNDSGRYSVTVEGFEEAEHLEAEKPPERLALPEPAVPG